MATNLFKKVLSGAHAQIVIFRNGSRSVVALGAHKRQISVLFGLPPQGANAQVVGCVDHRRESSGAIGTVGQNKQAG